ncbi:alkyl hydroperoxide reductase subunit C [Peptoniphilus sp.]|jgi:peroxiredoxin|uniref:alkyl hydroperoxide reductase subunit C n=1 Tax=Peptoniphilus sp. TaxID=1971214 RepID=UPI003D92CBDC
MSQIGKHIPEFKAMGYNPKKEEFVEVTNKDFEGKWTVLLFYPADFTFVCPTELEDMQEQYAKLQELGAEVYSMSVDSHFVHKAWHDNSEAIGKLEYTMLSDSHKTITRDFDVLDEEGGVAQRATFIIDPDGVIQTVEINADGIGRDASQVYDKLRAAQFVRENPGQVCPAKWKESGEVLTPGLDLVGKI